MTRLSVITVRYDHPGERLPFMIEEIREAHHWFEDQHSVGKLTLVMEG
jgi:hypothetical protein